VHVPAARVLLFRAVQAVQAVRVHP